MSQQTKDQKPASVPILLSCLRCGRDLSTLPKDITICPCCGGNILSRVNHPQTNGKLERFYGELDQKWPQFHHDVDAIAKWHNEIKPHMSLNWKQLETPIKAFHRKYPPDRPIPTPLEIKVKQF